MNKQIPLQASQQLILQWFWRCLLPCRLQMGHLGPLLRVPGCCLCSHHLMQRLLRHLWHCCGQARNQLVLRLRSKS